MSNSLDALRKAIEDGSAYWRDENLSETYFTKSISPKLKDALSATLTLVQARHNVDCEDDNDEVMCVHYTSLGRLFKMLGEDIDIDKSYLKLYDTVHLNDPDEGNYLMRQLAERGNHTWLGLGSEQVSDAYEREAAYLTSLILGRDTEHIEDNLVFWRTYGNEGKGCSIKFPIKVIHLKKVLYGEGVKETIAHLVPILDVLSPMCSSDNQASATVVSKIVEELYGSLKRILYLYKSSAYQYENEARIVSLESETADDKIHFDYQEGNVGRPRIRHYVEFESASLKTLLSSKSIITIGPTVPHRENVLKYLEKIKRKIDLPGPQIKVSEIAYRVP